MPFVKSANIFESSPDAMIVIDQSGTIRKINSATCKIFGYNQEELIGEKVNTLMPPEDAELHDGYIYRYLQTGKTAIIGKGRKVYGMQKSGILIPLYLTVIEHTHGEEKFFIGTLRNLELYDHQSELINTLGETINSSLTDVYLLDSESLEIIYANRGSQEKLGYNPAIQEGRKGFLSTLEKTSKESLLKNLKIIRNKNTTNCILNLEHHSHTGDIYTVKADFSLGRFRNKDVILVSEVDTSHEHHLEHQLNLILQNAPAMIFLINKEFEITWFNQQAEKINPDTLGSNVAKFLTVGDMKLFRQKVIECQQSMSPVSFEIPYTENGVTKWFSCVAAPSDEHKDGSEFIIIAQETTEQKHLQAQLDISSRLAVIGELAAGIGHEINNPLTIVIGFLSNIGKLLEKEPIPVKEIQQNLDSIRTASVRIRDIVKGLRTFSRLGPNVGESIEINECIQQTISMIKAVFARDQIIIDFEPFKPMYSNVNFGQLQQVLMNLLTNSRDALANCKNKKITVSVSINKAYASILVSDTGPGIEIGKEHKIFDPFYTSKPPGKGTGIGLSLSRKLIEEMKGDLQLVRSSPKGACFKINIPLDGVKSPTSITDAQPLEKLDQPIQTLIIDDETEIRELIQDMLSDHIPCEVAHAANGEEAIDHLDTQKFDLILTDIHMPIKDGKDFIEYLDSRYVHDRPVIIIVSAAYTILEPSIKTRIRDLVDHVIEKPFNFEDFCVVSELLQVNRNTKSNDYRSPST